jgi:RNA polymerase sigma factor (sigma-70 family)
VIVATTALARARAGDGEAFSELAEPYRRELQLHCYRILGSVQDAEDMLQETLLSAWRGLGGFEERASIRTWLYKIATNKCLNALRDTGRRPEGSIRSEWSAPPPEPTRRAEPLWLQPYPDTLLDDVPDAAPGPEARYETKEALALAFVAGLQRLPPRQRAVLVLRDVLGYPAADAFEAADTDRLVALLTDDAWLTMPPEPLEYQGHAAIAEFFATRPQWAARVPARMVPARANHQPAFGYYRADPPAAVARAHSFIVLTLADDKICAITRFGDHNLFRYFGLPQTLPR